MLELEAIAGLFKKKKVWPSNSGDGNNTFCTEGFDLEYFFI